MSRSLRLLLLALAVTLGVPAARRLLAMSNTQVHRINQHNAFQTTKESNS